MNIFRLAGDMSHLASILVLLFKIQIIKSCAGISLKTQELYAIVFATRYLDLFTVYISLYNTLMKLMFLGSSFSIIWYIRQHKIVRESYDKDQDTFHHYFLVLPCLFLALIIHMKFTFMEVMWAFSLFLEAVAILPQLFLLQRTKNIDNLTWQYVFLLGIYRPLYVLNWIYRYNTELYYFQWINMILWIPGLVQTLLYAIFFYYCFPRITFRTSSSLSDHCYTSLPRPHRRHRHRPRRLHISSLLRHLRISSNSINLRIVTRRNRRIGSSSSKRKESINDWKLLDQQC